jgi:prepilin-type N-terminal cleavage/methylation domain-containing protein
MRKYTKNIRAIVASQSGLTLIELVVTIVIAAIVLVVVNQIFFSTTRLYGNTSVRAGQQMSARAGLSVMVNELRTAGCDPSTPPVGIQGVVTAASDTVHVQADLTGDGAIQTAEPSEDVMYFYDPGQQALMRDPGTGAEAMIPNVTACQFSYFDVNNNPLVVPLTPADRDRVRSIRIDLTTETDRGGQMDSSTRVSLRNG